MSAKPSPSKPGAADAGKKSPVKGGGDFTCSKLLQEAGLASTMKELSEVKDGEELEVFLKPDVCRTRYNFPDLKGHIAPLIKQLQQPGRKDAAPSFKPFPDDALRQAFAINAFQSGPPLPLRADLGDDDSFVPPNKRKRGAK